MDNMNDNQDFDTQEFDGFLEYIRQLRDEVNSGVIMVNPKRMAEFELAYKGISQVVKEEVPDAKITYKINKDGFFCGTISIEADEIIIRKVDLFTTVTKLADNFEIYPLLNGNVRMSFMFRNVLVNISEGGKNNDF